MVVDNFPKYYKRSYGVRIDKLDGFFFRDSYVLLSHPADCYPWRYWCMHYAIII